MNTRSRTRSSARVHPEPSASTGRVTRSSSRAVSVGTSTDDRPETRTVSRTRSTTRPETRPVSRTRSTTSQSSSRRRDARGFIVAPPTPPEPPVVNSSNAEALARHRRRKTRQLMTTERKLVRSCEHVILLNDKIRGLTKRYQRARAEGFKSFRYNLRIRLAAIEGVRNMYYEYARDRAEEVAELRKELYDQNVRIVSGSDRDSDDESDFPDDEEDEDENEEEEDMDADDN